MNHAHPLSGIRIWLSGSVPAEATAEEKARLLDFVRELAKMAIRTDAILVHGFGF